MTVYKKFETQNSFDDTLNYVKRKENVINRINKQEVSKIYSIQSDNAESFSINTNYVENLEKSFSDRETQRPLEILQEDSGINEFDGEVFKPNYGIIEVTDYIFSAKNSFIEPEINVLKNYTENNFLKKNVIFFDNSDEAKTFIDKTVSIFEDGVARNPSELRKDSARLSKIENSKTKYFSSSGFTYKNSNYTQGIDSIIFGGKTK